MKKLESNPKYITKRANGSIRVQTMNHDPSLTDQSFADECDINQIWDKYLKTNQITHLNRFQGMYADMSIAPKDLLEAKTIVQNAENSFNALPAKLREKFKNEPNNMVAYLDDPKNYDESITLGLRVKPSATPTPSPQPTPPKPVQKQTKPNKPQNDDPNDE